MTEKRTDPQKMVEKMRSNTVGQNRPTKVKPPRRSRRQVPKNRPAKSDVEMTNDEARMTKE